MTEQNANRDSSRQPGRETGGSDSGPGNRPGRKGRRRYFQPKKDGKPQAAGQASGQSANQPAGQSSGQPNQSSQSPRGQENGRRGDGKRGASGRRGDEGRSKRSDARRRARSRQRYDDSRAANLEAEVAYVAPQSVYIYEHSVHPELRDSYEFRPDHFSKVGRTLDDYQIDLSKLFPGEIADDGTPVLTNMLPKPQFDWTGWEEEGPESLPAAGEAEQKG